MCPSGSEKPGDEVLAEFQKHLFFLQPPESTWRVDDEERSVAAAGFGDWKSSWIKENIKRILYVLFSGGGVAYGLFFSTLVQDMPAAPWWIYLLRATGIVVVPHFVPSVIGLCLRDEASYGPVKSTVPVTFRWCTRGDANSHLTRASVEMARKILHTEGHTNIRLQIVTDESFKSDGHVVRSHVAIAEERGQIGPEVDVVVVPSSFSTAKGTRKKGRALWYAALRDRMIRTLHSFGEHADRILNSSYEAGGPILVDFIKNWLDESIEMATVIIDIPKPESKPLGDLDGFGKTLLALPDVLRSLLEQLEQQDSVDFTPLLAWQNSYTALPAGDVRFTDPSAAVMHLDEESIVTREFISGVNKFASDKFNSWKMGQGAMAYADTFNRKEAEMNWGGFQARWCQLMDSIRSGDDAARFYFQYKLLNKIVFGAKGSFFYLPQVFEQSHKYSFDGGEATSITEDACLAFNVGPATLEMRATFKETMDNIVDSYLSRYERTKSTLLSIEYPDKDKFERDVGHLQHSIALALRKVGLQKFEEEMLNPLCEEMRRVWEAPPEKVSTLCEQHAQYSSIVADLASSENYNTAWFEATTEMVRIERELQELDPPLKQIQKALREKEQLVLRMFVIKVSELVDKIVYKKVCGVNLGLQECGWITGKLYEQSPFSFWEFIIQRRRWYTGLETLIREHEYIFPIRRFIFSMAMQGWGLMPLSLVSFFASFACYMYSLNPVFAAVSGWVFSTYLFLYTWGWLHQLVDSKIHSVSGLLALPFAMVSGLCIFEGLPPVLAKFWPDLNFELVEKHRGLEDLLQDKAELYSTSFNSLKNYEVYLDAVGEFYELYLKAIKERSNGGVVKPVPFEVFLDYMPKSDLSDIEKGRVKVPPQDPSRNPDPIPHVLSASSSDSLDSVSETSSHGSGITTMEVQESLDLLFELSKANPKLKNRIKGQIDILNRIGDGNIRIICDGTDDGKALRRSTSVMSDSQRSSNPESVEGGSIVN